MTGSGAGQNLRLEFERQFHSRTLAYLPDFRDDGRAVVVVLDGASHTPTGHVLAHALVNLLARAHRRLVIVGDIDRPFLCPSFFGSKDLHEGTVGLAKAINPFIEIEVADSPVDDRLVSLGIGAVGADVDLGADGWFASVGADVDLGGSQSSLVGASLAACLGSYVAFTRLLGRPDLSPGRWSAWDYLANDGAQGPAVCGPLDVGRVLCVGAGAVASALVVLGSSIGLGGEWTFVDGDGVDVSNLNRQLAFRAIDAGWPDGQPINKAIRLAAGVPGASASPKWYGEDADLARRAYDVVLPLANERGVRSDLAFRQATVMLHATTSASWQAQAHRHIAGYDDCLPCRLPGGSPKMRCSVGPVELPRGGSGDAALPFLSATAGLLLLVQMVRLMTDRLLDGGHNFRAVEFGGEALHVQRKILSCRGSCRSRLLPAVRGRIDSQSRWAGLGR